LNAKKPASVNCAGERSSQAQNAVGERPIPARSISKISSGFPTTRRAMEQRMAALSFGWADVTATQVYTILDIRAAGRLGHLPRRGQPGCPFDPPTTPSFYAFSYTVPSESRAAHSFVAAGSGEAREGGPSYEERIIRRGDQSPGAMRDKACFVPSAPCERVRLPRSHPGRLDLAFRASACQGLDFEVDGRGVAYELVI
jgi:hypothetical protein